ncbi:hypothetical protein THUN1379_09620 [Paludibacterium sp. THUN1379]|nr:hypothetical protein THUN1379_09620 [Paludibacterium sp. THUN1379]
MPISGSPNRGSASKNAGDAVSGRLWFSAGSGSSHQEDRRRRDDSRRPVNAAHNKTPKISKMKNQDTQIPTKQ